MAKRISLVALLFFGGVSFFSASARADAVSEMGSFSVFSKVDLADLAKTDVKTAHGVPMSSPRFLSVQSCYVMPRPPAEEMTAMRHWNPAQSRDAKVFLHNELPASPSPESFAGLRHAPATSAVRTFVIKTQKLSPDLQMSKEEAAKFAAGAARGAGPMPADVASFWMNLLSGRARAFASGGTAAQPPYNHAGRAIRPNEEFRGILREQPKVQRQFAGFLATTGIGRGSGSKPEMYWELVSANDQGVVTLGASYGHATSGGGYQSADALYYASGSYYVSLTLFQMWPVNVNGRPSTLVWRGDFISSAELESLHGIERLGSESAMMKDIGKAITSYRKGTSR